jgi:ribosomal protein L37AE/L43A
MQPYACPECAAALVFTPGEADQLGGWICPACSIDFGSEEALKKLLAQKEKGK